MTPTRAQPQPPLQLWGGVECTINRVGDHYFNQLEKSGHDRRLSDLDRFASLGITALRYPVLWEKHAPNDLDSADFSWSDTRLNRLRDLNVTPILGLLHHGSGPRHTSLLDPRFPEKFADYARRVADQYPWAKFFTPVNEPLTTARFSGLYGHWYPHARDERAFAQCLLTEIKATVLAMRAIREITPDAQLVQTEDLAKIHSTPPLAYQAEFENARRLVSFDLLAGTLVPGTRMYGHFEWAGIPRDQLDWFRDNPCPADIIGANYYVTSERFLDHRFHAYPEQFHADNGRHRYADVAACHVRAECANTLTPLLLELSDRYHRPIAITEAHLGCTREEQMRWLLNIWRQAQTARAAGADVRAVTAWCLLGAYNWNSLVTRDDDHYEPGIFDLRAPEPRPTGLAHLARQLASGKFPDHPVLDTPGWWQRSDRFFFPITPADPPAKSAIPPRYKSAPERQLLITGADTPLGEECIAVCRTRGLAFRALTSDQCDTADSASVRRQFAAVNPWAVIHAGGIFDIDAAERDPDLARRANVLAPIHLAAACAQAGAQFVGFSSDQVFNGHLSRPYTEADEPHPINVLGQTHLEAEAAVSEILPAALLLRTGPLISPYLDSDFILTALHHLTEKKKLYASNDRVFSPTFVPDLVRAALDLLVDGEQGLFHLANPGSTTWAHFALSIAAAAGIDPGTLRPLPSERLHPHAPRPHATALASHRQFILPTLEHALARSINDLRHFRPALLPQCPLTPADNAEERVA